jgi:hypothetical protein
MDDLLRECGYQPHQDEYHLPRSTTVSTIQQERYHKTSIIDLHGPEDAELIQRMWAEHIRLINAIVRLGGDAARAYEGMGREDWEMELKLKFLEGEMPDWAFPWMSQGELHDHMVGGLGMARHSSCPEGCVGHVVRDAERGPVSKPDHHDADPSIEMYARGRAWLKTVLRNELTDAYRVERLHHEILDNAAQAENGDWLDGRRYTDSPEAIVIRREEEAQVIIRINRLPLKLRDVAMLKLRGYAVTEIAGVLGITPNAVSLRLRKIRSSRLRAALGVPLRTS